ncbi:MAG: S24/S26 family peptidase [Nitrospirota bacterium]
MDNGNREISDTHLQAVLDIWNLRNERITCSVQGNCMSPVIKEKDTIVIESGDQDIGVGDVVVFGSPGRFFVKRVVQIYKKGSTIFFLTKGDKNYTFCDPVAKEHVVGKVIEVQSSSGRFIFTSGFWKYLNYILAIRSYVHGQRRRSNTLGWRAINTFFSLRSRLLPRNFSSGPSLWRGICRISKIYSNKQHIL